MVPSVGSSSPARHLASVVFPEPLRPTIATDLPAGTSSVMSWRIGGASGPPYLKRPVVPLLGLLLEHVVESNGGRSALKRQIKARPSNLGLRT